MYDVTAKTIKEVDDKIRVGGSAASGSKWVKSFLAYCKEHQSPVDFISSHQYAGDPIGGVEASEDLEAEKNEQIKAIGQGMMGQLLDDLKEGSMLDGLRRMMPDKSELVDIPGDGFRYIIPGGMKMQFFLLIPTIQERWLLTWSRLSWIQKKSSTALLSGVFPTFLRNFPSSHKSFTEALAC